MSQGWAWDLSQTNGIFVWTVLEGNIVFALGITNLQRNKPCTENSHHAPQRESLPKKKAQESRSVPDNILEFLDPPNLKSSDLRTFQLYDPLQPTILTYSLL